MANSSKHEPNSNKWVTAPYTGTTVTYSNPITFPTSNDKYPKRQTLESLFNDMFFLGFNDQLSRWNTLTNMSKPSNFPPYNLIKIDDDTYRVELAVAGYSKEDVEIKVDRDTLIVSSKEQETDDDEIIVYQGIAQRQWSQKFILGEYMEVDSATLKDGLLVINVVRNVPEEEKPKIIKIK